MNFRIIFNLTHILFFPRERNWKMQIPIPIYTNINGETVKIKLILRLFSMHLLLNILSNLFLFFK